MRQHDSLASIAWMLASTGDGGGRNSLHVEDILVSLFFPLIISYTFRILAHEIEKDQYSYAYKILGQIFV